MRIFSADEMTKWSEKLGLNSLNKTGLNSKFTSQIDTNFVDNFNKINYRFSFSISHNNLERFENLLNKFLSEGFEFYNGTNNKIHIERLSSEDLKFLKSFEEVSEHKTYNVDFFKFTYNFYKVPVIPCVMYIQSIIDVIQIIGHFWSFDENGKEICNMLYPVGSIVSLKKDRSDFFVESVDFIRENTTTYLNKKNKYNFQEELILYKLLKIESNQNSQVIQFSEIEYICTSADIIPNRGQRLDELLR
jgi:hypothetical protein